MGKKFVPIADADKRAIQLYLMLKEVEQMPLIGLKVHGNGKRPIELCDGTDRGNWDLFSIDGFLLLDVDQAKAEGGTFMALKLSRKKLGKPRLPQAEIDRVVENFMVGNDDE